MQRQKVLMALVGWLCLANMSHAQPPGVAKAAPPPARTVYVANQQGPSGGVGGTYCDTNDVHPNWRLVSINVHSGAWIDSINLAFNAGDSRVPMLRSCGGSGGNPNKILNINPGEYIVRVKGSYGDYVESLYIQTDGPNGPKFNYFGNRSSTARGDFDYIAPEGLAIAGLVIKSGTYVDAVGVVLRKRP